MMAIKQFTSLAAVVLKLLVNCMSSLPDIID